VFCAVAVLSAAWIDSNCRAGEPAKELMKLDLAAAPEGSHVHAAAGNQVAFSPAGMKITANGETFAHLEVPLSGETFSVSCKVRVSEERPGSSWRPGLSVYWDENHWCSIGVDGKGFIIQERPLRRGDFCESCSIAGAEPDRDYRLWIVLGERYVYFLEGNTADSRRLLFRLQRSLFPAGAPSLAILGRGYSGGKQYTQPHFDNNGPAAGFASESLFSDFSVLTTDKDEWNLLDGMVLDWPPSAEDLKPWVIPEDERAAREYEQRVYRGEEPTFEKVASFYPPIKYPNAIVGADGYPGKVFVAWNGDVVLPAITGPFSAKVGKGAYWRLACDWPPTSLNDRGEVRRSLHKGYLPIVTTEWEKGGVAYSERVFASRLGKDVMVVFMDLTLANRGTEPKTAKFWILPGQLTPTNDPKSASQPWLVYPCPLRMKEGGVLVENREGTDRVVAAFEPAGNWHSQQPADSGSANSAAVADAASGNAMEYAFQIPPGETRHVCMRLPFYPMPMAHERDMLSMQEDALLAKCEADWDRFLAASLPFRVPEKIIADAMKIHLINNQIITNEVDGHRVPSYGAYTYEGLIYDCETEEMLESMDLFGNHAETRAMIEHLLDLGEKKKIAPGGEYTNPEGWLGFGMVNFYAFGGAGSRVICEHFRLTQDVQWLRTMTPRLLRAADWIKKARATTMRTGADGRKLPYYGLIPRGEWCDIGEWEHWFYNSAFFYRSLRDIGDVLRFVDEKAASEVAVEARAFRDDILRSVDQSTDHTSDPPLIPMAPCVRQPYAKQQDLQANVYGQYWAIVGPSMLMHCDVVDPTDQRATWVLQCLEQRNGFLLGNARFVGGIDAKYGYPSVMTYLRRGEIQKVLLHLYGYRAYGMSRETASTPEGYGEVKTGGSVPMWWWPCLPDRFANSRYLNLVRNLLVREEAGVLHLLDGTPRSWLADGAGIEITDAPTYFGPLTLKAVSHAAEGEIRCELRLPDKLPFQQAVLRLRRPGGTPLTSVEVNGQPWTDFDPQQGLVRLPAQPKNVVLVAR
jgi:hypothetical protein